MTAQVGIARSLSEAYLSLLHFGVDVDDDGAVVQTAIGTATCTNAMLMARNQTTEDGALQPAARIVRFLLPQPRRRRRWWGTQETPLELFAFAVAGH